MCERFCWMSLISQFVASWTSCLPVVTLLMLQCNRNRNWRLSLTIFQCANDRIHAKLFAGNFGSRLGPWLGLFYLKVTEPMSTQHSACLSLELCTDPTLAPSSSVSMCSQVAFLFATSTKCDSLGFLHQLISACITNFTIVRKYFNFLIFFLFLWSLVRKSSTL